MSKHTENLEFRTVNVPAWAAFKPESAQEDDNEYLRNLGSGIIYKKVDEGYQCLDCDEIILLCKVAHPIWDGPFSSSIKWDCNLL